MYSSSEDRDVDENEDIRKKHTHLASTCLADTRRLTDPEPDGTVPTASEISRS